MRRNKAGKVFMILAIICVMLGSVLIGAGFVSGGKLSYLHIGRDTISWWPFDDIGVNLGGSDGQYTSSKDSWTTQLGDKRKIKIDSDLGDIEVRRGNQQEVVFHDVPRDYVTIKETGDEIEINIDYPRTFNFSGIQGGKLILYLKDAVYDLDIEDNLGDIRVQDLRFSNLDIESHLGDVTAENVETDKLKIDQNCGDITVSGKLLNTSTIENDLGDIHVSVNGNINEYDYKVKNNLGDTLVNGKRSSGHSNIETNTGKDHQLKVTNHLGEISVDFE